MPERFKGGLGRLDQELFRLIVIGLGPFYRIQKIVDVHGGRNAQPGMVGRGIVKGDDIDEPLHDVPVSGPKLVVAVSRPGALQTCLQYARQLRQMAKDARQRLIFQPQVPVQANDGGIRVKNEGIARPADCLDGHFPEFLVPLQVCGGHPRHRLNDHIKLLGDGVHFLVDGRLADFPQHDLAPGHIAFVSFLDGPRNCLLDAASVDVDQDNKNQDGDKARNKRDEEEAGTEFFWNKPRNSHASRAPLQSAITPTRELVSIDTILEAVCELQSSGKPNIVISRDFSRSCTYILDRTSNICQNITDAPEWQIRKNGRRMPVPELLRACCTLRRKSGSRLMI